MTAGLRTALTLAGLALLVTVAVLWGFAQATKPFPKKADAPVCTDVDYAEGDALAPAQIVVNVLNSSSRQGLAGRTGQLLTDQGFVVGKATNAPAGTTVTAAEIWVDDRKNPAVRLLRSYVGKVPVRELADLPYPGVNLVVGDQFGDLAAGRPSLTLRRAGTVCSPPAG